MTIPVTHMLPAAVFRHISLMICFMMVLSGVSIVGFLNINTITNQWINDIDHTMSVELLPYDKEKNAILTMANMTQNLEKLKNYLDNDPLIKNISTTQYPEFIIGEFDNEQTIPAPIFVTLRLEENRALNSENRIKNNIQEIIPQAMITPKTDYLKSIEHTAIILKTSFLIMAFFIVFVTVMMVSAIIKTILKAHEATVQLVHLLGAQSNIIATLFKRAMTKATIAGLLLGSVISLLVMGLASSYFGIDYNMMLNYCLILLSVNCGFLILARVTTHWTVLSCLRFLP